MTKQDAFRTGIELQTSRGSAQVNHVTGFGQESGSRGATSTAGSGDGWWKKQNMEASGSKMSV